MAFWYSWNNPPPVRHFISATYGSQCEHCSPNRNDVSDWVRYRPRIDEKSIIARYNHTTGAWETVDDFVHYTTGVWRNDYRIEQSHS